MNFFWKRLWLYLLLAGTHFFAAGAVIDAGAGGGDGSDADAGSADADTGDSGDSSGGDGSDDGSGSSDVRNEGDGQSDSARNDGRTLPKNIQSTLKTLSEQHPELKKDLDELRKAYFGSRQHAEFFKTPAEARQAKATLDLVGGAEGISNLQSQVAAIEMVDGALEAGDPQVLDDMFADFGEGMKKLAAPFLERLDKLDPQLTTNLMQPYMARMLESAELPQRLNEVFSAIANNKLDDAKTIVTNIYRWLEGQKQQAGRARTEDPERARLQQDRQKFESEKETAFRQDIGRQTVAHQHSEIRRVLATDPRFRKLSKDAQDDVLSGVNAEVNRHLKADNAYQSQMKTNLASRNRNASQIVSYVNATVTEVVRKAAPAVMTRRYGAAPAVRLNANASANANKNQNPNRNQNPAQSADAAPTKLSAKPKREDVDWAKTKDVLYITNKAYMKNGPHKGKLVTW